jgi:hypothetical protein
MALIQSNPFDTQQAAGPAAPEQKPGSFTAQTYNPFTRTVDDKGLVQNQVDSILSKDGPLMQRARTTAQEQMNGRGLINSSMAIEAGQAAMLDKALPMAQQDAASLNQADSDNMAATNNAGQFNTGAKNQFGLQGNDQFFTANENASNRAAQAQLAAMQISAAHDEALANRQFQTTENQANRSFQSAESLANQKFQTSENQAGRSFTAEQNAAQLKAQQLQQQIQQDFQAKLQTLSDATADGRQARALASQEALQKLQEAGVTNRFDQQQALDSAQFDASQAAQVRAAAAQQANTLEQMGYSSKLATAAVPANFAASTAVATNDRVNSILSDPNLDAAARQAAVDNVVANSNATLSWAEKFYGTTMAPISAPGAAPAQAAATTAAPAAAPKAAATPAPSAATQAQQNDYYNANFLGGGGS